MNIVMLGHSNAGKTSFMAMMYGMLLSPIGGFSICAAEEDVHDDLVQQCRGILNGHWPLATDRRSSYPLVLFHDEKPAFPFYWQDYRGGALLDYSSEVQAQELVEDLRKADGIVAFFPCDTLLGSPRHQRVLQRTMAILTRALSERETSLPLVLVLTKADLIGDADTDCLLAPLMPLIEQVKASKTVIGTVCLVRCSPEPINVELPVLFCLHFGLRAAYYEKAALVEALGDRARKARANAGIIDSVFSWLNSEPTWQEVGDKAETEARAQLAEAKILADASDALIPHLKDLGTF